MSRAIIKSVTIIPSADLAAPADPFVGHGSKSGRRLAVGSAITEADGDVIVLRPAIGATIPRAAIRMTPVPAVKVSV